MSVTSRKRISNLGPASKTLLSFVGELTTHSKSPLLDAGCGYGRNAVALASHSLSVVCVDQKLERLIALVRLAPKHIADLKEPRCEAGQLYPVLADLDPSRWPFGENCFAGIICVHFLNVGLSDLNSMPFLNVRPGDHRRGIAGQSDESHGVMARLVHTSTDLTKAMCRVAWEAHHSD